MGGASHPPCSAFTGGRKSKFFGRKSKPDGTNSKSGGTKSKFKSFVFLRRIEPFQWLTPTPAAFFTRFRLQTPWHGGAPKRFVGSSVFVSGSFRLVKQVKGWRRLSSRTLRRRVHPTCQPRSLIAKKGTLVSPDQPRTGKRQADRSDVRQNYVRFAKPDPASSQWTSGRAPALHAVKSISRPLPSKLIPSFRSCEANAAAFVGRVESAFHPATDHHYSVISIICKAISEIWLIGKARPRACRAGGQGLPLNLRFAPRPSAGQTAGIDSKHAFQIGLLNGREGPESGRRRYRSLAPTAALHA